MVVALLILFVLDASLASVIRPREPAGEALLHPATPRAEAMVGPLGEALSSVERAVQIGMRFDPTRAKRLFRVAMTDLHAALRHPAEPAPTTT